MDSHTFELTISREIQHAIDELLPQHAMDGTISRHDLQLQLEALTEKVRAAARDYYFESLRTVEEVAEELGVSAEHLSDLARQRYAHYGMGRKFGDTWVWAPDEVDVVRPQGE